MLLRVGTAAIASLAMLAACDGTSPVDPGDVTGLSVMPNPITVRQLESVQVIVTAIDSSGRSLGRVVAELQVADPAFATVNESGRLTSVGPSGSSDLIARYGTAELRVPFAVLPVLDSLTISIGPRLALRPGETIPFWVLGVDRVGDPFVPQGHTTSSSDPGVARLTLPSSSFESPTLTAVAPGTSRVTATAEGETSRIDVEVLSWVRTSIPAAFGIAVAGGVGFVAPADAQVTRFDPVSGVLGASYPYHSSYVTLNAAGTRAWFANTVFDAASGTEIHPAVVDGYECGTIRDARERADGQVLYLGCVGAVYAVNAGTGVILSIIGLGTPHPVNSLLLHPTQPRLYASVPTAGRVYEIDTETNRLVRELPILGGPQGALVMPDGRLVVAMEGYRSLKRWDLVRNTLQDSVALEMFPYEGRPFDVAISPDESRLLVSSGPMAVVLDAATLGVERTFWLGGRARRVAVAGGRAVVANEAGWIDFLPF